MWKRALWAIVSTALLSSPAVSRSIASTTAAPTPSQGDFVAPLMWVNSADDFIDPPEVGLAEQQVSPTTHGHAAHTWAINWKDRLAELLRESQR